MTTLLITAASAVAVGLILLPLVGWYQNGKKEMEEDERNDRAE